MKNNVTYKCNIIETIELSETHNERGLGEYGAQRTYCSLEKQGKVASNLIYNWMGGKNVKKEQ